MKKFLSLVLALVMTMSLVTISAGAEDFTDDASITYEEAVDVMSAVGVVGGYADGSFNPAAGLSRGAAAKIICNMILGPTTAAALSADTAPYKDVAIDNTYAGYIAYCAQQGIISGYADGTFRPYASLTGYAFMKMLLGALGYDADVEGYNQPNWSIAVAKRALNIGLDDGLVGELVGTKAVTREEACLYAFNTMTATMVEYPNASTITVGNVTVQTNAEATEQKLGATGGYDYTDGTNGIGNANETIQFCEKYFGKLSQDNTDEDCFGRPATTWINDREEIGTYGEAPVAVFATETNEAGVYAALKGYSILDTASPAVAHKINKVIPASTWTAAGITVEDRTDDSYAISAFDGTTSESIAKIIADLTKKGLQIEFYANSNDVIDEVVFIEYKLEEVLKVSTNSKGDITYSLSVSGNKKDLADEDDNDTVALHGDVAAEDWVTTAADKNGDVHVYPTTTFEGTQTAYNNAKSTITVDGAIYDVGNGLDNVSAPAGTAPFANSDKAATYYVDINDMVVYSDAESVTNYAAISAIAKVNGLTDTVQAELIFADGSKKVVTVASFIGGDGSTPVVTSNTSADHSSNSIYKSMVVTYKIDDDGEYELTAVKTNNLASTGLTSESTKPWNETKTVTEKGNPAVEAASTITANDKTIFVVKTLNGTKAVYDAYEGYKNVPTIKAASGKGVVIDYSVDIASGVAKFVYIDATAAAEVSSLLNNSDIVYITSTKKTTVDTGSDLYYIYDAVVNGEATTITTTTDKDTATNALAVGLYKITSVADATGYAKTLVKQASAGGSGDDYKYVASTFGTKTDAKDGVVTIDSVQYTYDGTETVYVIDANGGVSESTVAAIDLATNTADYAGIYIYEVDRNTTTSSIHEIDTIYLVMA